MYFMYNAEFVLCGGLPLHSEWVPLACRSYRDIARGVPPHFVTYHSVESFLKSECEAVLVQTHIHTHTYTLICWAGNFTLTPTESDMHTHTLLDTHRPDRHRETHLKCLTCIFISGRKEV